MSDFNPPGVRELQAGTNEPKVEPTIISPENPSAAFRVIKATDLPSKGLAYPDGLEITYYGYNLGELIHLDSSETPFKEAFLVTLDRLSFNIDDFQALSLSFADCLFLGVLRRMLTLGDDEIGFNSTCPICQSQQQTSVKLSDFDFEDIKAPKLPIRLTVPVPDGTSVELKFSVLTAKNVLDQEDDKQSVLETLALQVRNFPYEQALSILRAIQDPKLFKSLNLIDDLTFHRLKPIQVTCGNAECGKQYDVILDEGVRNVLYSFRESEFDPRSTLSFG